MNNPGCKDCLFKGSKSCGLYRKDCGCGLKHDLSGQTPIQKRRVRNQRIKIEKVFENLVEETAGLDPENSFDLMDFEDCAQRAKGEIKMDIGVDVHIHGGPRYGSIFFTLPEYHDRPIFKEDGAPIATIK